MVKNDAIVSLQMRLQGTTTMQGTTFAKSLQCNTWQRFVRGMRLQFALRIKGLSDQYTVALKSAEIAYNLVGAKQNPCS
jgi:uncharacterized protein YciW